MNCCLSVKITPNQSLSMRLIQLIRKYIPSDEIMELIEENEQCYKEVDEVNKVK